jgi:diguanylate cyclase (GGDEF)-like protein
VVDTLEREIRLARRSRQPLSLVCLDLDNFKSVNDRYGHNAGDAVHATASAMQSAVRGTDVVGRLGGEEFAVVLPHTTIEDALAERIRAAVQALPFELRSQAAAHATFCRHLQTASLGLAQLGAEMRDASGLLNAADARLYDARLYGAIRAGRNRVAV